MLIPNTWIASNTAHSVPNKYELSELLKLPSSVNSFPVVGMVDNFQQQNQRSPKCPKTLCVLRF